MQEKKSGKPQEDKKLDRDLGTDSSAREQQGGSKPARRTERDELAREDKGARQNPVESHQQDEPDEIRRR